MKYRVNLIRRCNEGESKRQPKYAIFIAELLDVCDNSVHEQPFHVPLYVPLYSYHTGKLPVERVLLQPALKYWVTLLSRPMAIRPDLFDSVPDVPINWGYG